MAERAAASPTAMLIGTAIISLVTGYMLGMASNLGLVANPFAFFQLEPKKSSKNALYDNSEESSESEIDEDASLLDHAPNWANGVEADKRQGLRVVDGASSKKKKDPIASPNRALTGAVNEECKLVLVVRTDLGMTKGKRSNQISTCQN